MSSTEKLEEAINTLKGHPGCSVIENEQYTSIYKIIFKCGAYIELRWESGKHEEFINAIANEIVEAYKNKVAVNV